MKQIVGIFIALGLALVLAIDLLHGSPAGSAAHSAQTPDRPYGTDAAASRPSAGSAARGEAAASEVAALRREVADLKEQMTALRAPRAEGSRQDVARLRQEVAALREDGAHDAPAPPLTREEGARARATQMQEVETAFWRESVDRRWSQGATEAVTNALASDAVGAQLPVRGLECRSHSCRVELADEGSYEPAMTLPVVLLQLTQTLPNFTTNQVDNPDGTHSTILYLTAGGKEAPPRVK